MKSTTLCPKCSSKRVTFDRLKVFLVCVESDGTELEIAKSVPNIEKNFHCTECGNNFEEHNYLGDLGSEGYETRLRNLIDDVAEQLEEDSAWDNPYPLLPHE